MVYFLYHRQKLQLMETQGNAGDALCTNKTNSVFQKWGKCVIFDVEKSTTHSQILSMRTLVSGLSSAFQIPDHNRGCWFGRFIVASLSFSLHGC